MAEMDQEMDERTDDKAPIITESKDDSENEQPEATQKKDGTVDPDHIDPLMEEWDIRQAYEKIGYLIS